MKLVCIDVETKDVDLKTKGVGSRRKGNHLMGVGIGILHEDGTIESRYYNLAHTDKPPEKMALYEAFKKIRLSGVPITGANLLYDFDWIKSELKVSFFDNPWQDIQVAEPLIDEQARGYSLNRLAEKYLGETKNDDALFAYCARKFKGKPDKSQMKNLWKCPYSIVEPYALADVELPLRIHQAQLQELQDNDLIGIWGLECRLQPVLLGMKLRGVRVDVGRTEELSAKFQTLYDQQMHLLKRFNGGNYVEIWAAASVAKMYDRHNEPYPLTPTGKPSFTKAFLAKSTKPFAMALLRAREYEKSRSTFLENAIMGNVINGRIHAQFNQLRGDEYGTITGRLSSSLPNLQQVPARSEEGKLIRTLFVPEEGEKWGKSDYSQIEPRLLLTYAPLKMVKKLVASYHKNANQSCYKLLQDQIHGVDYNQIKAIYLGATYGMGKDTMAAQLGCSVAEAEPKLEAFHDGAPYIKKTSSLCMRRAEKNGEIRTIGGRGLRFPTYEPLKYRKDKRLPALPYDEAVEAYGSVKRAFTHKALNKLIQGGAADIMKHAMVNCYEAGLFDEEKLGFPLLTVHDELDVSYHDPKHLTDMSEVMEAVFSDLMRVKMRCDVEVGPNWGEVK